MARKTSASGAGKTPRQRARERVAEARAAEASRERRTRLAFRGALAVIAAAVIGVATWLVVADDSPGGGSPSAAADSRRLPEPVVFGSTTAKPPWSAPASATAGAKAAGLDVAASEGTVNHFHTHLDVIVDGKRVPVPAGIGIDRASRQLSELHTHDDSGVLHIESPVHRRYILGQLFDEWGVALTAHRMGGLTTGHGRTLTAYVNGTRTSGDPAAIELTAHREIALVYGAPGAAAEVPSSYDFPKGL